jgi:hypothetical protein
MWFDIFIVFLKNKQFIIYFLLYQLGYGFGEEQGVCGSILSNNMLQRGDKFTLRIGGIEYNKYCYNYVNQYFKGKRPMFGDRIKFQFQQGDVFKLKKIPFWASLIETTATVNSVFALKGLYLSLGKEHGPSYYFVMDFASNGIEVLKFIRNVSLYY